MHPLLRAQGAQAARRMHARGWMASDDGKASARIGRDRFLIAPAAASKRRFPRGLCS